MYFSKISYHIIKQIDNFPKTLTSAYVYSKLQVRGSKGTNMNQILAFKEFTDYSEKTYKIKCYTVGEIHFQQYGKQHRLNESSSTNAALLWSQENKANLQRAKIKNKR